VMRLIHINKVSHLLLALPEPTPEIGSDLPTFSIPAPVLLSSTQNLDKPLKQLDAVS